VELEQPSRGAHSRNESDAVAAGYGWAPAEERCIGQQPGAAVPGGDVVSLDDVVLRLIVDAECVAEAGLAERDGDDAGKRRECQ
jgi:hypothetical protein